MCQKLGGREGEERRYHSKLINDFRKTGFPEIEKETDLFFLLYEIIVIGNYFQLEKTANISAYYDASKAGTNAVRCEWSGLTGWRYQTAHVIAVPGWCSKDNNI